MNTIALWFIYVALCMIGSELSHINKTLSRIAASLPTEVHQ